MAYNNVELRQQALGKRHGTVSMTLKGFDKAIELGNTMARFVMEGDEAEIITIDSLDLPCLDFLKLDIEGSEVDALHGAMETLTKFRPTVLFEGGQVPLEPVRIREGSTA